MRRTLKTLGPLGVAGIMMSLGLTSCTQPAQQPTANAVQPTNGSTSPAAPLIPLVWADGTRVTATAHSIEQARSATAGQGFTEESSSRAMANSRTAFQIEAVDSSGALVGTYGTRQSVENLGKTGQVIDPDAMLIGRYVDGTFESFTIEGNPEKKYRPQEVIGTTATDSGVIWVEVHPEDADLAGWEILGVSPGTTDVRVLATSSWKEDPGSYPDTKIITPPVLIDGRIYWSVEYWNPAEDLSEYKMLSVDLANPVQVREEIGPTDTGLSAPTGPLHAWGGKIVSTSDVPDDSKTGTIQTISSYSPGGQHEEIIHLEEVPAGEQAMRLMGSDARGFAVNHDENLYLIDPNTRQAEVFPAPKGAEIADLNQCGPRVSWSYEPDSEAVSVKRYVYNRDSRDLSVVTTASSLGGAYCFGEYMSWPAVDHADPQAEPWDVVTRWKD